MSYRYDPFRAHPPQEPEFCAEIIFSKYDRSRVKVKINDADTAWSVSWGDTADGDVVESGVTEVIHQYGDTQQGTAYEIKVIKGTKDFTQRITY
jgi:hypothetical protein